MTIRKFLGVILIILGITIFISLITLVSLHDYRLWNKNDSGKAEEFPTFIEYWWNFNKGTTVLSFALGALPGSIGIVLLRKSTYAIPSARLLTWLSLPQVSLRQ